MVCGEAGAGAEDHVVQGGKREAKTHVQAIYMNNFSPTPQPFKIDEIYQAINY